LLLTKSDADAENDGLLEAREIMNSNLRADLAVLSACETANGRISPGEGVMGMSWGFFVAGTRSMLVSQWKVNSASTTRLMFDFYEAMESKNASHAKAKALQSANLQLLKVSQFRHPFYWAAFVLLGSN
jgi:CHAT domain-containing protein